MMRAQGPALIVRARPIGLGRGGLKGLVFITCELHRFCLRAACELINYEGLREVDAQSVVNFKRFGPRGTPEIANYPDF